MAQHQRGPIETALQAILLSAGTLRLALQLKDPRQKSMMVPSGGEMERGAMIPSYRMAEFHYE